MKNLILAEHVRRKIDIRIERLLGDLGNPEPPLRLVEVQDRLELDVGFFQREETGLLAKTIHKIRIGTIQSFLRPTLVLEAVRKFNLRALCAPDLKRILIDQQIPELKHRWLTAHEIIHQILDWHHDVLFGDNEITPTASCHAKIEAEANYGAGQLLFLRDRFFEEASSSPLDLKAIRNYKKTYGNTHTCTLWRAVEMLGMERPLLAVVTHHPHVIRRPADFDPTNPCRYFIQSEAFAAQFKGVTEHEIFDHIVGYSGAQTGGLLGEEEIILTDDNGDEHVFVFETFFNRYEALTLAAHSHKRAAVVPVSIF